MIPAPAIPAGAADGPGAAAHPRAPHLRAPADAATADAASPRGKSGQISSRMTHRQTYRTAISPPPYEAHEPCNRVFQDHDDHHHHDEHHHDHHHEPGMPFDFAYAVNEDGNDYSHNAKSDGDVTIGQYRVALPDGRTQIVKYTADWRNGFNAEDVDQINPVIIALLRPQVMYEGEARYPDQPSGFGRGPGQQYAPAQQGGGYKY
ncbi:Pro-resilin [Eumeta japonica]|uniref:Pro-resilin n=1 Tax=Eumeta variegata TaxID=151549 RepID=A0A4C1YBK2_EUMVA|nr:Pro-resilin [Eumeta japonica]